MAVPFFISYIYLLFLIKMKNIFIVILILSINFSNAQTWAPIGAKWHIGIIESVFFPDQGYFLVESIDDTLISGENCKILSRTRYHPNGNIVFQDSLFMYEDSGKVYNYLINNFYTLYDFNAQPGDTWTVAMPYPSPFSGDSLIKIVVDSVTTTIISGQNLKTLYVHSDSSDWYFLNPIIENIGSMSGLFPFIYDWMDSDVPFLRCYEDSIIYYQTNPSVDCDSLITSINNISGKNSKVKIWPVPFRDFLNIENTSSEQLNFTIYNSFGEQILFDSIEMNSMKQISLNVNDGIFN